VIKIETRIKDLRIDNDLTQSQIAQAIGITQRKYSYIETGIQPLTAEIICKLAKFYGTSADYILKLTDKK
jgi:transcriptional regulator with XRE-family HTH domain